MTAVGSPATARGGPAPGLEHLRSRLRQPRFWFVHALVLLVTIAHGSAEFAASRGLSNVFIESLHYLPVEAYILPVVLAGWWYGLEGGLFTALLAGLLSVPNLILFHAEGLAWLGELAAITFVLAIGVVVAFMVEREAKAKDVAVTTTRRLEALHDVTSVLNRRGEPRAMVEAVLEKMDRVGWVRAAAFVSSDDVLPEGVVVVGEPSARKSLASQLGGCPATGRSSIPHDSLARIDVTTSAGVVGSLVLDCGEEGPCVSDLEMLDHVGRELASALENAIMHARERAHLQGYARAVVEAQENERKRIARDLHDGAAQSLVVLSRGLGRLAEDNAPGTPTAEAAAGLHLVAKQTLRSIRRVTWALRPALLDDLGLLPAIESLADHQNHRSATTVDVKVSGVPRRLADDIELAAFRITQEALSNVERHSDARTASVTVDFEPVSLKVTVKDDGRGFDGGALSSPESFGFVSMQERAELVGGRMEVRSRPGLGTTVSFDAPA